MHKKYQNMPEKFFAENWEYDLRFFYDILKV